MIFPMFRRKMMVLSSLVRFLCLKGFGWMCSFVMDTITKKGNYLCERADKIERRESVFLALELKPANGN